MQLSPKNGPTYANLPTFVRVTFDQAVEIGPGGDPYVTDTAAVQGAAATVWLVARPMQLATRSSYARRKAAPQNSKTIFGSRLKMPP